MTEEMRSVLKHWRRLLECTNPWAFCEEGFDSHACQFCNNRRSPSWIQCDKKYNPCPIYKATKVSGCNATPYHPAQAAIIRFMRIPTKENLDLARKHVKAEVEFLEAIAETQEHPNRTVAHFDAVGAETTFLEERAGVLGNRSKFRFRWKFRGPWRTLDENM